MMFAGTLPTWSVPAATGLLAIVLMLLLALNRMPDAGSDSALVDTELGDDDAIANSPINIDPDPFDEFDAPPRVPEFEPPTIDVPIVIDATNESSTVVASKETPPPPPTENPDRTNETFFPWDRPVADNDSIAVAEDSQQPEFDLDSIIFRIEMNRSFDSMNTHDESFVVNSNSPADQLTKRSARDHDVDSAITSNTKHRLDDGLWSFFKSDRHADVVIPAGYESQRDHDSAGNIRSEHKFVPVRMTPVTEQKRIDVSVTNSSTDSMIVNQLSTYWLTVENHFDSIIEEVSVAEFVPAHYRIVEVLPAAEFDSHVLRWKLRNLQPNEQRRISIQVFPMTEGDVRHSAIVRTSASVVQQTLARNPETQLAIKVPKSAPAGKLVSFEFEIKNTGSNAIPSAKLRVALPEKLNHRGHRKLAYPVKSLAVGETRTAILTVRTQSAGIAVVKAELVVAGTTTNRTSAQISIADAVANRTMGTHSTAARRRCVGVWYPTIVR